MDWKKIWLNSAKKIGLILVVCAAAIGTGWLTAKVSPWFSIILVIAFISIFVLNEIAQTEA